jgi:hypothetical protein
LEHIAIPKFSPNDRHHAQLAELAERCHAARAQDDAQAVSELQLQIDAVAAKLWSITDRELKAIQDALAEAGQGLSETTAEEEEGS